MVGLSMSWVGLSAPISRMLSASVGSSGGSGRSPTSRTESSARGMLESLALRFHAYQPTLAVVMTAPAASSAAHRR